VLVALGLAIMMYWPAGAVTVNGRDVLPLRVTVVWLLKNAQ